MLNYIIRRVAYMIILLIAVSVVSFVIIQLPPGDFVSTYIAQLQASGTYVSEEHVASLTKQYGLDKPMYRQYLGWIWKVLHGNLGYSFNYNQPVSNLLAERLPFTVILTLFTIIFVYVVAVPIGIYSATHQYSVGDYVLAVIGFAGLAIPNFLLALVLLILFYQLFGLSKAMILK